MLGTDRRMGAIKKKREREKLSENLKYQKRKT